VDKASSRPFTLASLKSISRTIPRPTGGINLAIGGATYGIRNLLHVSFHISVKEQLQVDALSSLI
jgi:hypothetical protein